MSHYVSAREETAKADALLKALFSSRYEGPSDAIFLSSKRDCAIGVCGLSYRAPALKELRKLPSISGLIDELKRSGESLMIRARADGGLSAFRAKGASVTECALPADATAEATAVIKAVGDWAGRLNERGEHVIDIKTPSPGPHFFVNLLLGNRMDFDYPLQTTPKSVVDRLGRGSFRSHAATQVLATRWDLRQEENGFPCNRQFYLVEGDRQVFYSGNPEDPSIAAGECVHGQNRTHIAYETSSGLKVERTIFLPRQEKGLPIAVEVQRIAIRNDSGKARSLKLVYTGMFGPSKPPALQEDVLYSNIIMEGGVLLGDDGTVRAVSPRYFPAQDREDLRFHSMVVRDASGNRFPDSFCLNYNDFVGRGSVDYPDGLASLTNELYRKGPGFFALSAELEILPGATAIVDNFTGLISSRANPSFGPDSLKKETDNLLRHFANPASVPAALEAVSAFFDAYSSFFSLKTGDEDFSAYCSRNLPFQVLYQTFVSRSFDQTQKGYREIGFREIQDLFASMYYFHAQGNGRFVKRLILDWAAQVHEFGFANHNFFWEGKEAGNWSDDALWLHQAVSRYVNLTGDASILDEEVPVASSGSGTAPVKTRSLYKTLLAAIRYSAEISVGRHGLPLLDRADWNDCLRLDRDYKPGPEKERIYKEAGSFKSDGTESVMNGFLAALACSETIELARLKKDDETARALAETRDALAKNLRTHAWKNGAYARLLFSKYPGFEYAGADGDGLDTDGSGGTFFLNSFSWSVLSGVASDSEIASMLEVVRRKLKTPYGLKLVSPNDLSRVVPGVASAEYFPGDRENGAVFKHASMMAVSAMLDAAKSVKDRALAAELASEAWNMIDLVYPARTMTDPFVLAGNPRFCTQYNNSETGENIGPLLSGTATWLILGLLKAFGIELTSEGLIVDPILRLSDRETDIALKIGDARISVRYAKPEGFRRRKDGGFTLRLDGKEIEGNAIPLDRLQGDHRIVAEFE
ncbi:MAG TPA: hypothetical protein PKO22_04135 [Treponemataceae bacterium]|nr:hypothetical protein [Treponemataceae bacterium]